MKILLWILMTFFSFTIFASDFIIINETQDAVFNQHELLTEMRNTKAVFEQNFGALADDIRVTIKRAGCFRTGYDFVERQIVFCKNNNTINYGLNSIDVIRHELFHAFVCQKFPETCQKDTINVPAHEAVADYFTFLLRSDEYFGENFYTNYSFIRYYRTNLKLGFVETEYELANVYCDQFIQNRVSLRNAMDIFRHRHPPLEYRLNSLDLPYSNLSKYRLKPQIAYRFQFEFSARAESEVASIVVEERLPTEVEIYFFNTRDFSIKLLSKMKPMTVTFNLIDGRGMVIGKKKIYLGSSLGN